MLVLIPNRNTDTREIRLLEVVWKVMEGVIYTCMKAEVQIHDVLHGFHAGRGTGRAIIEFKISQ